MVNSLGYVVVPAAGTPVPVTNNNAVPATRVAAQSVFVQALPTNAGKVYIGAKGMNKTTGAGVIAIVPAPLTGVLPSFTVSLPLSAAGLNAAAIYLDVDTNGEGAVVSYTGG